MRSRYFLGVVAFFIAGTAYWWFAKQPSSQNSASRQDSPESWRHSEQHPEAAQAKTSPAAPVAPPARTVSSSSPSSAPAAPVAPSAPAVSVAPSAAKPVSPAAPVAPAEPVVADTCTTQIFTHQTAEGHEDGEACLYHKNLIHLTGLQGEVNAKSVCVRVNNKPVKYKFMAQKQGPQILLGPVAGPTTKISVTYCTGRMTCSSDCTVPKDDFMEAIGGAETDEDLFTDRASKVGWKKGKNPKKEEEAVQRELAELKKTVKDELKKGTLFEGWDLGTTGAAVCGHARAQK